MAGALSPLVSVKHLRVIQWRKEEKKKMPISKQLSNSFDSSYSTNPSDSEPVRPSSSQSVFPRRTKRLKNVSKHGKFSRCLPTPGTSPSRVDQNPTDISETNFNLDLPVNVSEFQTSTPTTEIVCLFEISNDADVHNLKDSKIHKSLYHHERMHFYKIMWLINVKAPFVLSMSLVIIVARKQYVEVTISLK